MDVGDNQIRAFRVSRWVIGSQAALWLLVACLLLVVPQVFVAFFGEPPTPLGIVVARLFGAELTALAIVCWFTRGVTELRLRMVLYASYFASNWLGFLITLTGTISGALNERGWLLVVLYLAYAAAFTYSLLFPQR